MAVLGLFNNLSTIFFTLDYKVKKKYLSRSCRIPGGQALLAGNLKKPGYS